MFSIIKKFFGSANDRIIKKFRKDVDKINEFESKISPLTDAELSAKTKEFRKILNSNGGQKDILHESFAVIREVSKRVLGLRHYDVQIIGGLILNSGAITEMGTGEGKTLMATLPAYLNALSGKGVHIVTVNDYLARRDAISMGKIFEFLGITVGYVTNELSEEERKNSYNCDIIYATNNELGFDYLRDNMKYTNESKVQRGFNYAIVDEVDSILIDEARTPLIISGPVDDSTELHEKICNLVKELKKEDFEIDEKINSVTLTDSGINRLELMFVEKNMIKKHSSLYDFDNLTLVHYVNQSLRAHNLFSNDVDYLIKDGKIVIIDEFTGRVMDGRRYSDGLHQAIEAKEKVQIQNENQTLASITFQNYFRNYPKLAGMTGTAMTEAEELKTIYNLDVISVPTHKPITRTDHEDDIYGTKSEKYKAVLELIKECNKKGQPVLVGTISIEKSEEISKALFKNKINHNVLNAKNHEREAHIIAQAGRFGAVTIATNMAGRGTDIMLGGNPEMLLEESVQGLSAEDRDHEFKRICNIVEKEKEKVLQAGGLYVIATERHESRRIDNQLRGRSGRQGDPGSTKFFLSLEDDLMRIFASDRISGLLRTLGLKNGEAIQHPMISRSLEKAQSKVEGNNYEIRKSLLKFDDVMNDQRKIIYEQRNEIIEANEVKSFTENFSEQLCQDIAIRFIPPQSLREDWKIDELVSEVSRLFSIKITAQDILNIEGAENEISQFLLSLFSNDIVKRKEQEYGVDLLERASKYILITTLDQVWKEHLHSLDYLRQGISLRAYGQKDPLSEYKREAFGLFEQMLDQLKELYIQRIGLLYIDKEHVNKQAMALANKEMQQMSTTRSDPAFEKFNSGKSIIAKAKPFKSYVDPENRDPDNPNSWGKISRNESCPCNSGKKYKHCHGQEV